MISISRYTFHIVPMICALSLSPTVLGAQGLERSVYRAAERSAKAEIRALRLRDWERDISLESFRLRANKKVFRYVTAARARLERLKGLGSWTHTTATASAGRPLSALHAKKIYGLAEKPVYRESIVLPKGTVVRQGRVLGGARRGEIIIEKGVPPSEIKKVVPLH